MMLYWCDPDGGAEHLPPKPEPVPKCDPTVHGRGYLVTLAVLLLGTVVGSGAVYLILR